MVSYNESEVIKTREFGLDDIRMFKYSKYGGISNHYKGVSPSNPMRFDRTSWLLPLILKAMLRIIIEIFR